VTYVLPVLAWAYLEANEVEQAAATVAHAVARMRPENLRLMLAEALWVQARVRGQQGQVAEATQAVEEGIALARDLPYPYAEARLLCVHGHLHLQQGNTDAARQRLEAALAIFHRLGACKDADRVEHEVAALRRR
jgi:predicted negative regulator of RcsB-dependent stress response